MADLFVSPEGLLAWPGGRVRCALGKGGIRADKREGDGATPRARLRPLVVWYRPDRWGVPDCALPAYRIRPDSGWCDDPADRLYNRPVRLPYGASAERMWRDDHLYDVVVVLDHNIAPVRPGAGSAIFMHLATPDLSPTEGCVALAAADMRRLLPRLGPHTYVEVG